MEIKNNNKRKILIIINVLLFLVLITPLAFLKAQSTGGAVKCNLDKNDILLSTSIPGLNAQYNAACNGYVLKGDFVTYLQAIYKFFVGIAGILAVFMIMFGGIQWLFAGGSSTKISSAKETIFGAVIGLILALCSYSILQFINPKLVNFTDFVSEVTVVQVTPGDWLNQDGTCKASNVLPCGAICQSADGKATQVIGVCSWCNPSNDSRTIQSCGLSKSGNRCVYAGCPSDTACTYISQQSEGFLPGSTYAPQCSKSITIKKNNISHSFTLKELSGNDYACGDLVNENACHGSSCGITNRYIGTKCSGGQRCVIDVSKGYLIDDNWETYDNSQVLKNVGNFNDHQCIN